MLIVGESTAGVKRKSKASKKHDDARAKELFSGDGTGKSSDSSSKAGGKGAKFNGKRVDSGGMVKPMSKMELNKLKRGGKGKQAFKSKSRFKRK